MNTTIVGILGLLTIVAIVVTLFKSKTQPAIAFIVWPTVLALILIISGWITGENFSAMIKSGFSSTGPTAALFVFSVLYFGIMTDAGMFDVIINKLMKLVGDSVVGVCVMTAVIALIGHLDGGGASTFCIVVPAMLPVFKRMHMRKTSLLRIAVLAMGVLNLMPWAGPTMRAASVLGIEAGSLWQTILPIQIFGIVLALAHAVFTGFQEKKRGAGLNTQNGGGTHGGAGPGHQVQNAHGQNRDAEQGGLAHVRALEDGQHGGNDDAEGGGAAAVQVADQCDDGGHDAHADDAVAHELHELVDDDVEHARVRHDAEVQDGEHEQGRGGAGAGETGLDHGGEVLAGDPAGDDQDQRQHGGPHDKGDGRLGLALEQGDNDGYDGQ